MSTGNNIEQVPGMLPMPPFTPEQRAAACVAACEGLPDHALYGGWTAAGMSRYTKSLEDQLAAAQAAPLTDEDRRDAEAYRRINTPEVADFLSAVHNEALHQRERWGAEGDPGKTDADWFWLVGYLAGKAIRPDARPEKQLHHVITTAAACLNWHAARVGNYVAMRPGIATPPHSTPNPRHCRIPERPIMDYNTVALQPPTIIGTPFEGGFYAGMFRVGEQLFALIVAPKAGGEFADVAWHQGNAVVEGASSCFDGMANTAALAEAGSILAQRVRALDLNGFTDWHLPSRDELELLYRHLKPTPRENWARYRDGDNPSSVPVGYPYTKDWPAQTTAEAFREGGPEAFEPAWHWASTQYGARSAWLQDFAGGFQDDSDKAYEGRARAVRRFLIT